MWSFSLFLSPSPLDLLCMTGTPPQTLNFFWRAGPLWYRLPPLDKCSRDPSVLMYQLSGCCERLCWAFFWRLVQRVCPFHDGWFTITPAHTALITQQFLTKKQNDPRALPSLFTWSCTEKPVLFVCLFPWMRKFLKGKHFADVEEVKQKASKSTIRHQNRWGQNLF